MNTQEEVEGKEQREWIQLLALHIQKGNAALFNNRVPDTYAFYIRKG